MFHGNYMKEQFRDTGVDTDRARLEQLPRDFRDCCAQIFVACVQSSGLENGSIMFSRAPQDLRLCATTCSRISSSPKWIR